MKNIYNDNYLKIDYSSNYKRFQCFWNHSPDEINFKKSLLVYKSFLKKFHPKQALWIQKNFKFIIGKKLRDWVEANINIYQKKYGIEKFAFVVCRDLLVHLAVLNSFEEVNSVIRPRHFVSKADAIKWLDGAKINNDVLDVLDWEVQFENADENDNVYLRIKQSGQNILETLNMIKHLISKQTSRTHWKNIKRKLSIKSFNEVTRFINAFNLK